MYDSVDLKDLGNQELLYSIRDAVRDEAREGFIIDFVEAHADMKPYLVPNQANVREFLNKDPLAKYEAEMNGARATLEVVNAYGGAAQEAHSYVRAQYGIVHTLARECVEHLAEINADKVELDQKAIFYAKQVAEGLGIEPTDVAKTSEHRDTVLRLSHDSMEAAYEFHERNVIAVNYRLQFLVEWQDFKQYIAFGPGEEPQFSPFPAPSQDSVDDYTKAYMQYGETLLERIFGETLRVDLS